jgi:hypothetical protein
MKQVAFLTQQSRHYLFALLKLMMFTLTVTFASTSMLPDKLLGVESGDDVTYVVMREEVELPAGRVQIGDVADIRGGPAPRRLQIARLELEESACPGSELIISQRRVVYRIRLAGIHPDTVRIEGARMTRVRFKQTGSVSATGGDVVLVAARSLQPGELLSPNNTRTEHRVGESNAVSPNAAYGRAVSRNISPNQVIRAETHCKCGTDHRDQERRVCSDDRTSGRAGDQHSRRSPGRWQDRTGNSGPECGF